MKRPLPLALLLPLLASCGDPEVSERETGPIASTLTLGEALDARFGACDPDRIAQVAGRLVMALEQGEIEVPELLARRAFLGDRELVWLLGQLKEPREGLEASSLFEGIRGHLSFSQVASVQPLLNTGLRLPALRCLGALYERGLPSPEDWRGLAQGLGAEFGEDVGDRGGLGAGLAACLRAWKGLPEEEARVLGPALALGLMRAQPGDPDAALLGELATPRLDPPSHRPMHRVAIRALGFVQDAEGRSLLGTLSDAERIGARGEEGLRARLALGALARRGDEAALSALAGLEDELAWAFWLDLRRNEGMARFVRVLSDPDPYRFEIALLFLESLDDRAWQGLMDPRGLDPGPELERRFRTGSPLDDPSRLSLLITGLEGGRRAALGKALLAHEAFARLPELVERRDRLMELLGFLEVLDRQELGAAVDRARSQGSERTRGFWNDRHEELRQEASVDRLLEEMEVEIEDPAKGLAEAGAEKPDSRMELTVPFGLALLGREASGRARLRALRDRQDRVARHAAQAGLALLGDEDARADCLRLFEEGRIGWIEAEAPYALSLDGDPSLRPAWIGRLLCHPDRFAGLSVTVLPMFGLEVHEERWPERLIELGRHRGPGGMSRILRMRVPGPDRALAEQGR